MVIGGLQTLDESHLDDDVAGWEDYEEVDNEEAEGGEDLELQRVPKDHEINQMGVFDAYEFAPRAEANGGLHLKGRWVSAKSNGIWRCRWVVKEFKHMGAGREGLFTVGLLGSLTRQTLTGRFQRRALST